MRKNQIISWVMIGIIAIGLMINGREIKYLDDILSEHIATHPENKIKSEYIGEYLYKYYDYWGGAMSNNWKEFAKKDISDEIDGYTKIENCWRENKYIFYYKDCNPYKKVRKRIEKLYHKELKRK